MKKLFALLLAAALLVTLGACAAKEPANDASSDAPTGSETISPLDVLETVWGNFSEDEKFPVVGGDLSEENMKDGAPGNYAISDASELDRMMGFPQAEIASITAAASLTHMMNGNTFTCGAYQLASGVDAAALAEKVAQNIQSRQWMCGFPDKLVVAYAGGCLIAMFGIEEDVNLFRDKLMTSYSDAAVLADEAITA